MYMKITGINLVKQAKGRDFPIEAKLLQYYILCQLIWGIAITLAYFIIGMPQLTVRVYLGAVVGLIAFLAFGYILNKESVFIQIYFILYLIVNPVLWYFSGGARTSANILFVGELVLFVMCLKGKKQTIYIILSLLTTVFTQRASVFLPEPVFPMEQWQYQKGGSVLGLATSLLIVALLIRQKQEYANERDIAVEAERDLERSNSLQKTFLANMSHEIRSPLGIVLGFNDLIKESDDIDKIHEYSKDITSAGSTLLTVINDILDYSKIESGKMDIIDEDYSFSMLMNEIKTDIGLKCEEKGLKFVTDISEDIPECLKGDVIRIKQCLINVLSNAVKYTEKGTVRLLAECTESKNEEKYHIRFVVKDTGKGISEEAIPNLYNAFQRLDESMNRGIEGTGLGMAITKNLLDEMDGTISVRSKLGEGTEFSIGLWQTRGEEGTDKSISDVDISLDGVKVLAVDDTELNLILVKRLLEKEGAIVNTIDNGRDCLKDVMKNKYDIILLDHMMPDMNGVEVYLQMKKQGGINSDTPIIMLTANAMAGAMKEYLEMGFNGYLSKPVTPKDLRETVAKIAVVKN